MKILTVNTHDIDGGAARAAYRLHKSLLKEGIDAQMLVMRKQSDDFTVVSSHSSKPKRVMALLRPTLDQFPVMRYKDRDRTLFSSLWLGFSGVVDRINALNPDIVHLHWVCGGMLRIEDIAKIKAPIVWTLHDNWLFTGGCHIMWECEKYKEHCESCPRLGSTKKNDLSHWVFGRKEKSFIKIKDMTIVGLSSWLHKCAKESFLLRDKKHLCLPNPIDTTVFKPLNKKIARELWHLPQDKKLILFGANFATGDINKGFKHLSESLHKLTILDVELVVFGSSEPKESQDFGFKTHYLGHLHDDVSLVTLYSACDVMVVPSLQENLSNAIMESLSCAIPVVAFDVGGNGDLIDHKQNGFLAKAFDTTDLKDGIEWVLSHNNYEFLCQNAREKVVKEFDSKVVAKRYIKLYEEVIKEL